VIIEEGDKVRVKKSNTIYTVVSLTYGDCAWVTEQLVNNLVWWPPQRYEQDPPPSQAFTPFVVRLADCSLVMKGKPVVVTGGQ
jgi:hypothetical protein